MHVLVFLFSFRCQLTGEPTSDPHFVKLHPAAFEHTTVMKNERKFGDLRTSKQQFLSPKSHARIDALNKRKEEHGAGAGADAGAGAGVGASSGAGATQRTTTNATNIVYRDPTHRSSRRRGGDLLAGAGAGADRVVYKDPTQRAFF